MTQHWNTAEAGTLGADVDRNSCLPRLISSIANKISRGGSRVYIRMFGIGIIEWRILSAVADNPRCTANAICDVIELDKAAASRSIQVLVENGHLQATVDPSDARKRTLSLTPAGIALHRRAATVARQREQQLLAGFSEHEREMLLGLLGRMQANAVEMDPFDYELPKVSARPRPPGLEADVHPA